MINSLEKMLAVAIRVMQSHMLRPKKEMENIRILWKSIMQYHNENGEIKREMMNYKLCDWISCHELDQINKLIPDDGSNTIDSDEMDSDEMIKFVNDIFHRINSRSDQLPNTNNCHMCTLPCFGKK